MRGVYEATYKISNLAAAKTVLYLTAPASAVVEILGASLTNASNEVNEQIEACLQRIETLGTPTATTLTPAATEAGDQPAASTVQANVTADEPTYAANTVLGHEGAPSLGGWTYEPGAMERAIVPPGASIGLRLLVTPASAFDAIVRLRFRELG